MVNMESMQRTNRFIMLDVLNSMCGNELDRNYPIVQIVYPSNDDSHNYNQATESHPENGLMQKKRRKYFITISLNVDADY